MGKPIIVTAHEYHYYDVLRDEDSVRCAFYAGGSEYFAILPEQPGSRFRQLRERFRDEILPSAIIEGRTGDLTHLALAPLQPELLSRT